MRAAMTQCAGIVTSICMLSVFRPGPVEAQEIENATIVDPAHYTVVFENDRVRVVRIRYGPGERSPMHSHRAGTYLFLTDGRVRFTLPDGGTSVGDLRAGSVSWSEADAHAVENLGDRAFEIFVVEPKGRLADNP